MSQVGIKSPARKGGSSVATELRRIIFSNADVIEAIKSYSKAVKERLPDVAIVSCRIDGAGGKNPTFEIRQQTTTKHHHVTLKRSFIGAALVKWCLQNDIPMSRSADKQLEVVGDNLSIAMTINLLAEALVEEHDGEVEFEELTKTDEAIVAA